MGCLEIKEDEEKIIFRKSLSSVKNGRNDIMLFSCEEMLSVEGR